MRMDYEELKVWRDAFALLVRVPNLSNVLQDDEGRIDDFESLRAELMELMTNIYRACEADDAGAAADHPRDIRRRPLTRSAGNFQDVTCQLPSLF